MVVSTFGYEGRFTEGKFDGKGTLIYPNGAKYAGQFKDGKFDGLGTYTQADGVEYKGQFEDGKRIE